ncbi:hypothetical protein L2E82_45854 [Cichorium intybus]|uniref:Uncharacterized protein n=1 Tax=Cichorium intybus TaxID=13427 RepID=A0ACB8ZV02_CICIN|nr:hypothetical protein L2E82_45854 [Cichorium intybus]
MKQSAIISLVLFSLLLITDAESNVKTLTSKHRLNKRSPLDSGNTPAIMTLNSFEKGGDGGGPSECDGEYHSDNYLIVALSSKWYNNGQRCFDYINIYYNGNGVRATVVDECDSINGGCGDNIVDASYAVWVALQVPRSEWGEAHVTWSDA